MLIFFKVFLCLRLLILKTLTMTQQNFDNRLYPIDIVGINAASFVMWFLICSEENAISHK